MNPGRAIVALMLFASTVHAAPPPGAREAGWLEAGERRRVFLNRAPSGGPIRLAGRTPASGIAMAAPAMLLARLDEPAVELAATIGVDESPRPGSGARGPTVRFVIWADGRRLFESEVLTRGDPPRELRFPLPRARDIVLALDDGRDGPVGDHAFWGEPRARIEGGGWVALAELPWRPPPARRNELAAWGAETSLVASLAGPGRESRGAFCFP